EAGPGEASGDPIEAAAPTAGGTTPPSGSAIGEGLPEGAAEGRDSTSPWGGTAVDGETPTDTARPLPPEPARRSPWLTMLSAFLLGGLVFLAGWLVAVGTSDFWREGQSPPVNLSAIQ